MRFFQKVKDGGPNSPVDAYVLIEIKNLFSIMFLKFNKGEREQFHTHAFHAWTWFLGGEATEERLYEEGSVVTTFYRRSWLPKFTSKGNNHRVIALKDSWCFTLRGPWQEAWTEHDFVKKEKTTFTHGRKVLSTEMIN